MVSPSSRRVALLRGLALVCACSLSIGSHFGQNTLGPLKSQLSREKGTTNGQFGLLIAAFALNSTWTPLVGGLFAARLGTSLSSIIATSIILTGQLILLLGELSGSVKTMVFGMFIFGLGISPLAVVQETIIVRYFKDHGLGLSLALGLVAGKSASFISARVSFPLSQWSPHAPFFASTFLAGFSFTVNLLYLWYEKWIAGEIGAEADNSGRLSEQEALHDVTSKRKVQLRDLLSMGDIFWLYIGINIFCGFIWTPFPHLAPNIIEHRYGLSEGKAAEQSSFLLAGSAFLYPICGYITDRVKKRSIVHRLLLLSSVLTLACYAWLALPPTSTGTPLPAMLSFGLGIGFSPLLLVIIVPHLVPLQYVSTALGAHKSIESSGSTIMQTLAGLALDSKSRTSSASIQKVINAFLTLNIIQMIGVFSMMKFDQFRQQLLVEQLPQYEQYEALPEDDNVEPNSLEVSQELQPLDSRRPKRSHDMIVSPAERARGKVFFVTSALLIAGTWLLFMTSAGIEFWSAKT
ncbi:Major facilitator superfamily domain-containing protein 1 [Psilocybe cubensis]|uniref:Major facilitator superfamily domain-containing protein 1 n=2 Tax=Psilocybe cubensis TaxID=181762 RepID=A0ACB8GND3_PSICU|nr:Major facilitator superfamily domain-containing protein 1 [Psilocybe cubensis]KAH9476554.1 Major facilitator superfamily domain-containing protein 1 [Psilocybe cubensis]